LGPFSIRRPCPLCGGHGVIVEHPCRRCGGAGVVERRRQVRVRVPPGIADGQRVRLAGQGEPGLGRDPPGDLFITVRVSEHDRFTRAGRDLHVTVPITYPEAVLGGEVPVPDLRGEVVVVPVPPGSGSGTRLTVPGRGVAVAGTTGDLVVRLEVAVPRRVGGQEADALRNLALAMDWDPRRGGTGSEARVAAPHRSGAPPDPPSRGERAPPRRTGHGGRPVTSGPVISTATAVASVAAAVLVAVVASVVGAPAAVAAVVGALLGVAVALVLSVPRR
jgi:DnaJ-class molecular chaperone